MLNILLNMVKIVLPGAIVVFLVTYINFVNEKSLKQINIGEEDNLEENYVIAYPKIIYRLMYVCTIFFFCCLFFSYLDNQLDWFTGTIFGGMSALGVYAILGTHVWKIWVYGKNIIYRGYNGIKHYYTFSDITKIDRKINGAYVYYVGNKRAFKIDNNLVMGAVLTGNIRREGVPCELEGMNINSFKLKPRSVYVVISIMSTCFFAYILRVLVEQNEMKNSYFIWIAVGLMLSILLLFDLLMDRFLLKGNEVIRRRGIFTKKFQINEIEYVRLKKGLLRENLEFYKNDKCITRVWTKNRPFELLESRLLKEKIRRRN